MLTTRERLSEALRETYKAAGWSQDQIAEVTGITQSTISKYVRGAVEPPLDVLEQVEDALSLQRGHILRRAGYVADEVDGGAALATDPSLDAESREFILDAYAFARRRSGTPAASSGPRRLTSTERVREVKRRQAAVRVASDVKAPKKSQE